MPATKQSRRLDQFQLKQLFGLVAIFAVLFAVVRIGLQIGLFTIPGMAALGCAGILAITKWLLLDHEFRIEAGTRKQFDAPTIVLFGILGGMVWLFLQLLPHALQLVQVIWRFA